MDKKNLIGKRVVVTSKGTKVPGVLSFLGINPLHGQLQATVGRCPIWPVDSVKEIKSKRDGW